jgi:hypothetical protein
MRGGVSSLDVSFVGVPACATHVSPDDHVDVVVVYSHVDIDVLILDSQIAGGVALKVLKDVDDYVVCPGFKAQSLDIGLHKDVNGL